MTKQYPVCLIENSNCIEAYIVGLFWKEPDLYLEYKEDMISEKSFVNEIWRFYFTLGRYIKLKEGKGILDDIATDIALNKFGEKWKNKHENYGGHTTILELTNEVKVENLEGYYSDLKKYELLRNLYDNEEKTSIEKNIQKFNEMTTQEIQDYYDYSYNEMFLKSGSDVKVYNLCEGLKDRVVKASDKPSIGLPFNNLPLLNSMFQGLGKGCLYEFGLHSGRGKSSFACETLVLSAIEQKEKICIIANEEGIDAWQNLLLTTVLKYKFNYNFDRQRWLQGEFTEQENTMLDKAIEYLDEAKNEKLLLFAPLTKYKMDLVKKIIKKNTFLGCDYYIFDTFKAEASADWKVFMDSATELYDICKPIENGGLNIGLFVTTQLSKPSINKRYLDEGDIGVSKGIVDVASVVFMGRRIRDDERTTGKFALEVFKLSTNGDKQIIPLSDKRMYYIFWVVKNRRGKTDPYQVVAEVDLATNYFKEVGIVHIPNIE